MHNGNSHKGQLPAITVCSRSLQLFNCEIINYCENISGSNLDLTRTVSGISQSSLSLNGERRESIQSSLGTGFQARNNSIRGSRRPTMMVQGEDGLPVAPDCYPPFCYNEGICCVCSSGFKTSKIRKLWTTVRTKINFFVEHKYFESFILFLIVVSSLSLVSYDTNVDPQLRGIYNLCYSVFSLYS